MFKKLLLFTIILFSSTNIVLASNLQTPGIDSVYSSFLVKLEKKISTVDKRISFLKLLNEKIDYILLNYKSLNDKQVGLLNDLTKLTNEELFNLKYNKDVLNYSSKMNNYSIDDIFTYKAINKENIFLENGVWYYYNYNNHLAFPNGIEPKEKDLTFNKIDRNTDLVFLKDNGELGFAVDYKKVKLVSDDIIFGVTDKYNFLKELKDDKKYLYDNTDELLKSIKEESISLTNGKPSKEKIKILYNYILDNIEYPLQINLADKNIFSGLSAYKLKTAACEGYTKLFNYMLKFSGVTDAEVLRGFVIDAQDFPNIGHAWVKIGNYYYDPTFDDPVGLKETLDYSEYKYYGLPKDLFYTNRYFYDELPESLKTTTMEYRKNIIIMNLASLVSKYEKYNYNLLKPFKFREENNINYNEQITLSNFDKIKPMYTVDNFKYTKNGVIKTIKKLSFYTLIDENIETILEQLNYDLSNYYFYKWKMLDGSYEYRLGYNIQFK